MNIRVTGLIVSNDTQITRMINFHPHFRETVILGNFYKIHDEKCSFLSFSKTRVKKYHMKTVYFGQCSCCLNIDKNNYPEEMELDTNPSSNPNPIHWRAYFGHFTSSRCYDTTIFDCMYMNSPKIWGGNYHSRNRFKTKNHNCMKLTPREQIWRK